MNRLIPHLNSWKFIFIGLLACQGTSFSFFLLETVPPILSPKFVISTTPSFFRKLRARAEFQYFLRYVFIQF